MTDPLRRRLLIAAAALPAVGCALPPASRPGVPVPAGAVAQRAPRAGERWRYSARNGYNNVGRYGMVVEHTEALAHRRFEWRADDGTPLGVEIVDADGRLVQDPAYGYPEIRFETPVPWIPVPLAIGEASFIRTAYFVGQDSFRYDWSEDRRIGDLARVSVPAGDFDCLRIERRIQFSHPDFTRYNPYRHDVTWYAPALGRWIRREWRGEYYVPNDRGMSRLEEDWRIWELIAHDPAPIAG